MTKYPEIFERLAALDPGDVKRKPGQGGKTSDYITARTAMNILDDVLGPENWWDEYTANEKSVMCRLTIRLPDGSTVTKCDAGGYAGMSDAGDDEKSGFSDAFKRACVKFLVGRRVYNDGVPTFSDKFAREAPRPSPPISPPPADLRTKAQRLHDWCVKNGHLDRAKKLAMSSYRTDDIANLDDVSASDIYGLLKTMPPGGPEPVEPRPAPAPQRPQAEVRGPVNENGNPIDLGWPRSGKGLFAWSMKLKDIFHQNVVPQIDEWAASKGFPGKYADWNAEQVEQGACFAARVVASWPGYDGQFDAKIPSLAKLRAEVQDLAHGILQKSGFEPDGDSIDMTILALSRAPEVLALTGHRPVEDINQLHDPAALSALIAAGKIELADHDIPF